MQAHSYYRRLFDRSELSDVQAMVTWCRGASPGEVVTRLGADWASGEPISVREALEREAVFDLAVVGEIDGAVLVAEPFGVEGSRPEMAKRLSSPAGFAVSVFWNVEWDNAFTVAEDGILVVQFDMRDPGSRWGRDPDRFAPLLENFDAGDWMVSGLALAEVLTGLRLPENWTSVQGLGVRVVSPPQDLVPDHYLDHPVLNEREVAAIMRQPRPEHLPLIARIAAETAVRHTGLSGESVTATLAWLGERRDESDRARLQVEMARMSEDIRRRSFEAQTAEGGPSLVEGAPSLALFRQADAALALSEALDDDAAEAASKSVSRASILGLSEDDGLRLIVLQRCAHRIRYG
jgi:hypothetical protein